MMKKPLIVIGGPTACGKTGFSIRLAKEIGGEVISADSMQIYRYMDIGTAKVTPEEADGVPHYLIDELNPDEEYNVMLFQQKAKAYMEEIWAKGRIPILVGGTGFYINALLYDNDFTETENDTSYREECYRIAKEEGPQVLYERLRKIDPAYAETIHANNVKRVTRALEYHYLTGQRFSEHNAEQKEKSIQEGKVSMETLNTACRRILVAKYKLGLFDNPYKYCDPKRPARDIFTKAHRDAARRIAAESFVLLKNDSPDGNPNGNPLLPFNPKGNIAVIGPLANSRANMPGTWSVAAVLDRCPSLVEGLKEMTAGKANIMYAKGSNLISDAAYEERATMFGRSLNRDNRTDQQLLDEALNVARRSDIIIAALGESSEMSGESSSRTNLNLPDVQQNLLKELLKTGKPVVLVLFTGRPLTLNWEQEHVPAILNVWFGGSEAAYAIGDALFGYVNPGGKLTMTFPKNVGQIPLYYAHKNTGRPLGQGKWFEIRPVCQWHL